MFGRKIRSQVFVSVLTERCVGCGKCTGVCRHEAMILRYSDDQVHAWLANLSKCTGCARCAKVCRYGAIEVSKISDMIEQY